MKVKALKIPIFVEQLIDTAKAQHQESIDLSPATIQAAYEKAYPNLPKKDPSSYRKALIRMNLNGTQRKEISKELLHNQAQQDIAEYKQYRNYVTTASNGGVQQSQIDNQCRNMRKLWEIQDKTNPDEWDITDMFQHIEASGYKRIPAANGSLKWEKPAALKALLSPYSTMWKGKLSPNWSAGLEQHKAGELKDYFRFHEFHEFQSHLTDSEAMSYEGWQTLFRVPINMGCREGSQGNTGIMGLQWEDINLNIMRCSLREKGHRGHSQERWENVPLDMFRWLKGGYWLKKWHEQQGYPKKGRVFPISYKTYNDMFHKTARQCNNRWKNIDTTDSMRLHTVNRRTHGQWCCRLGIPLEYICGKAPQGRFGVGWKDPKIPVNYYLSEEEEEIDPEELYFMEHHQEDYADVLKSMNELNEKKKKWMGQ